MKELASLRFPLLFAAVFSSSVAAARSDAIAGAPTGAVVGTVRTSDGRALPHVAVILEGPAGSTLVTTGPEGGFRASGLAPGEYRASVDAPGLSVSGASRASVAEAETRLDLVLVAAPVREHVVVSATRGEAVSSTLGIATDVLDREQIDARAARSLLELLQDLPGVAAARTGGTGLQASLFIRGGESSYARILVDGVPVNQPGGSFDLGTALPFELQRIEIVRGAASSLYGSDALAGVVSLTTRRATPGESPSLRLESEGGGFDWRRFSAGGSGSRGPLDWNLGAQRLSTDNAQPNSAFRQTSLALSAGLRLDPATEARLVGRFDDGNVGTPGPTAFGRPDLDASFQRQDVIVAASLRRAATRLSQQLSVSLARTNQLSLDPLDSGPWTPVWQGRTGAYELSDVPNPAGFQNRTARLGATYQADLPLGRRQLWSGGIEAERETGAIGDRSAPLLEPHRTSYGVYLQDRVLLGSRAYLTAGGRLERNGSYGARAGPRVAMAVRLRQGEDATTLRASAGMGIKEPSFLQSYGESLFAKGNPNLDPERSTTFDAGLEQRLFSSRLRASATVFDHEYRDEIAYTVTDYTTYAGTYVNLARTRSRGVEVELEARPLAALRIIGQYTFQDGKILESPSNFDPVYAAGRPLLRRPRHQASLTAGYSFGRGSVDATLLRVGARADSDFVGLGLSDDPSFRNPGYTRFDLRARLRVVGPLEAFAVGENLADAQYQEALGYPALGRSLRGGLRLSLGGRR